MSRLTHPSTPPVIGRRQLLAAALLTSAGSGFAQAPPWPSRPLTFVTSSGAGGQSDGVVRALADALKSRLGQAVAVDNKPGANATIASQYVAKAAPDGYTWLFQGMGSHTPVFSKNNSIVLTQAMLPVANVYASDWIFMVRGDVPVNSIRELAAWSQKNDLKVGGATTSVELALAMMNESLVKAGSPPLKFRFIPYRNDPAIVVALGGKDIEMALASPSTFLPHMQSGAVRPLLTTYRKRSSLLPNIPATGEQGLDFGLAWNVGLWAPQGTRPEIVKRMSDEVQTVTKSREFADRMALLGVEAAPMTPDEQLRTYNSELQFWTQGAKLTQYEPK